ncbi:MAG: hypothetical protein H6605_02135 [Flavobacteriales bacterium]|nr:hypothetical protein [Flavobacteriales bacterium]
MLIWPWHFAFKNWHTFYYEKEYTLGINFLGQPIEHYIFIFSLVFFNLFIFTNCRLWFRVRFLMKIYYSVSFVFFGILIFIIKDHFNETLTAISIVCVLFLLTLQLINRRVFVLWFYPGWFISLFPMFLLNLFLMIFPVYIILENSVTGIRLLNIPVEVFLYQLAIYAIGLVLYEWSSRSVFKIPEHTFIVEKDLE